MALTQDETTELKEAFSLLSADELRAQLGDDPDHDALIQSMLDDGKAVEVKGKAADADDTPAPAAKKADATASDDDGDDDDPEATGFVDEHGNPVPDPNAAPAAAATTQDDATAQPDTTTDQPAVELAPLDLSFLDAKYTEKLQALDTTKAEAFAKLMDGEITAADYSKVETDYFNQRDALRDDKALERQWWSDVHKFQAEAVRTSGINYQADPEKNSALDDWVKRLSDKPEHADKPATWFLQEAHKKVMAEFDIAPIAQKTGNLPDKNVADGKKVAPKPVRAPKLDNIPPTLGGLPVSADSGAGDAGEFSHLDRLTGMDFERALAKMTPDQKARYEAM